MMQIDVATGSRMHFGLICGTRESGWQFGGIGLMLRQPSWRMTLQLRDGTEDRIVASPEATPRVRDFLRQIRSALPLRPIDVDVTQEIPFHAGFGGGTQLGMALAAASVLLTGRSLPQDPHDLAQLAQRAERSAVGTVGFRDGGFLVDHGLSAASESLRQVHRIAVPEDWRFVLVRPAQAQGLSGDRERTFFSKDVQMPKPLVKQLSEQIEHQLVPAVRDTHFDNFARALEAYGQAIGSFYAAEQGDVFAHPIIRRLVAQLQAQGVQGAAQSSWGPGICIPARSLSYAHSLLDMIPRSIDQTELSTLISEPLNTGATLRSTSPEGSRGQLL